MLEIRTYQPKDRSHIENICLAAGSGAPVQNPLFQAAALEVFCHYYLDLEPENCFVAVDEQDEAVGYILCAIDFYDWEHRFDELYMKKSENPVTKMMGQATVDILRPFAVEYPAHLHIDIHPDYQKKGLGTRLMDTLKNHLINIGVKGLLLNVARDNENGIRFYEKYGFSELKTGEMEVVMGMKF